MQYWVVLLNYTFCLLLQVVLSGMFNDILTNIAQQVSLTLMYEEQEIDTTELLDLEPMEIASYVVTLQ